MIGKGVRRAEGAKRTRGSNVQRGRGMTTPVVLDDSATQKAKHLPMFGPGIVVSVPLLLLPAYMTLYHLKPLRERSPYRVGDAGLKLLVEREAGQTNMGAEAPREESGE